MLLTETNKKKKRKNMQNVDIMNNNIKTETKRNEMIYATGETLYLRK